MAQLLGRGSRAKFCHDVMRCFVIAEEVKLTLKPEGKVLACQSFMSTLLSPSHQVNVFGNVTELLHELTIAIWVGPWISTTVWWFKYTVYYKYLFAVRVAQAPAQRCLSCAWNNNKVRMTHLFFCVHWWKLYFISIFSVVKILIQEYSPITHILSLDKFHIKRKHEPVGSAGR